MASSAAIPVRLLSSVAVVGRDNEPIYLRGDLCDYRVVGGQSSGAAAHPVPQNEDEGHAVVTEDEGGADADANEGEDGNGDGVSPSNSGRKGGRGSLLGRIKGVVGRNSNEDAPMNANEEGDGPNNDGEDDDDHDDDDPFGFFGSNNSNLQSNSSNSNDSNSMSLTQQLVLHASLDRFEEMASRSNRGGAVRWRTPGSNSANAMWMGLLCRVEERWNVYGYLTNTGIKFMILVENIYLNRDGSRFGQGDHHAPPMMSSSLPNSGGSREADLKNMFAQLHELYVRYTLNPFSQLRSPIQSRVFDKGIVRMAESFNSSALEQVSSVEGGYLSGGSKKNNGLVWM